MGSLSRVRESGRSCSEMEEWHWKEREGMEGIEVSLGEKDLEGRKGSIAIVEGERVERGGAMDGGFIQLRAIDDKADRYLARQYALIV